MPKISEKALCADTFVKTLVHEFSKIHEPRHFAGNVKISLQDCLSAGFAIFSLKWPSLLRYEHERKAPKTLENLKNLYYIKNPPSDTYLRERLDALEPSSLRPCFKKIFSLLQRRKALESFQFIDGYYLVSLDGTGLFSSNNVHCANCCEKHHFVGTTTYYHQMLGVVMLHPEHREVIPLCPEFIQKQDGINKNDCEQRASKRLLMNLRREHPHLKIMLVEDALSANAPHIRLLQSLGMRFLIVAKGHYEYLKQQELLTYEFLDKSGTKHQYRFINGIPLNGLAPDIKVNYFEHTETNVRGKKKYCAWITDVKISSDNVHQLMRGGRSRWKIENETFNTLKNQGYHFEHNFGHGYENLCSIMTLLMMLAFLIDQAQLLTYDTFLRARTKARTFYALWEDMRALFRYVRLFSWDQFLESIAQGEILDTS